MHIQSEVHWMRTNRVHMAQLVHRFEANWDTQQVCQQKATKIYNTLPGQC